LDGNANAVGLSSRQDINRYHTFWRRVGALFVDALVLLPVTLVEWWTRKQELSLPAFIGMDLLLLLITGAYMILLTGRYGQTLGKMLCGVVVVRTDGLPLNYFDSVRRYTPYVILGLFSATALFVLLPPATRVVPVLIAELPIWLNWPDWAWLAASLVAVATNRKRRALHDYWAGTEVVRKPVPPSRLVLLGAIGALAMLIPIISVGFGACHLSNRYRHVAHEADKTSEDLSYYWRSLQTFISVEGRVPADNDEFMRSFKQDPHLAPVVYLRPATTNAEEVVIWSKQPEQDGGRLGMTQQGSMVRHQTNLFLQLETKEAHP